MNSDENPDGRRRLGILGGALLGAILVGGIGFLTAVVYLGMLQGCWS